ncbi:MAG: hypothetical protein ACRD0Q_01385 [Acidimicrobiales bacterium]
MRADLPVGVALSVFEDRLADAIAATVESLGGQARVLRVGHALDPRWSTPLDPVPDRAVLR